VSNIQLSNTSQPVSGPARRQGLKYYDWKVFVDADPDTLQRIDSVTYILDPTFPDPVRTVNDQSTKFALATKGWGEFEIRAQIRYKDGSSDSTSYRLDLTKGVPDVQNG
jgi:transcription initiation factor IIF auxiliary subunit